MTTIPLSLASLMIRRNSPLQLPAAHRHILRAILDGATLKIHRTLDGAKTYLLHPLTGPAQPVDRAAVEHLRQHGLIASNMKFPVATYVLTERGVAAASRP